ncbi:GAF domain-containing protein [Sediminicola sp. 1XM1-17]|uniref:GAF domain-containing protein n=1 Tax=Sediminicola sp. 1XM1-17 TaxID=3127702 RepID=UPI003077B94B
MEYSVEQRRIKALHRYEILDTPADGCYDEITSLATKIFDVPISIISLVDTDRIWFKSTYGIDSDQIPRDPGLCSSAIMSDDVYVVENARLDPRTMANPLVAGVMGLQFYAAAPLTTSDGYHLGTICIIDKNPRILNCKEGSILLHLSRIVMDLFDVKLQAKIMYKDLHTKVLK